MKKFLCIFLLSLFAFLPMIVEAREDKAVVHVFYAEWCGNCTNLHNFLNELESDKNYNDMFDVVYYRLDNANQYGENKKYDENNQLFLKASSYLKTDGESIPFLVVGEKYEIGFSKTQSPDKIKELIKNEYFNKNKKNIVQDIIDEKIKVEIDLKKNKENEKKESSAKLEEDNKKTTTIIGIGVIILTLIIVVIIIVVSIRRK